MSIYSKGKEIYSDVQKFRQDNSAASKIIDLLKIVSFLIACMTFVFKYWRDLFNINKEVLPMFPIALSRFFDKYTFVFFIGLIIYNVIGKAVLVYFMVRLHVKFDINLLPLFKTAGDILEIGIMFILSLKLSGNLVLCLNGVDIISIDKNIYFTYFVCSLLVFISWLYIKNKNYWNLGRINIIHHILIVLVSE